MIFSVKAEFSAAHLYHHPQWTPEKNQRTFGACYSRWGHGHNYTVEIACEDPGNFQSRKSLQNLIRGLASELDNKHLNYDIAEFKQQNPTTENLVRYFEQKFLGFLCRWVCLRKFLFIYTLP